MSIAPMYRTNSDGTRVQIDWHDGKTLDEKMADFDAPLTGRGGKFLEHVANVLSGKEEARTPFGKLMAFIARGRSDDASDYRDVLIEENPNVRYQQAGIEPPQNERRPSLGDMIRQREEEQGKADPVVTAINGAARELGVTGNQLLEAISNANAHVQPGARSRAMEEVAETLGVSQEDLIKAGRNHGFTMDNGKIIVEAREQPERKISSSMLKDFERPDWAGDHQAKHDDVPQGARVAAAAGIATGIEGRG